MKQNTYKSPSIGSHLTQANYNSDELSRAIIRVATDWGMALSEDDSAKVSEFDNVDLDDERSNGPDSDLSEALHEISEDSIAWLNEQETRPFLSWSNNGEQGSFGLWVDVDGAKEDCAFVSSKRQEYPAGGEDYTGEWLHVNDHGNCTLYVREAREGSGYFDREIWSIV